MTGGEYYRATVDAVRDRGNYFKAVRPHGCSFADASFRYAVGETATAEGGQTQLCRPGLLHFSDTPSETLTGGEWPCRLFEVAPSAILGSNGHMYGARSLTVVRELPAWMALGPNGRAVAAFIALLPTLDADAVRSAARAAARAAAREAALSAASSAARSSVWFAVRSAAWSAAWDAVCAIAVADLITPEQFAALYRPFAEVLPIKKVREHGCKMWPMWRMR